MWIEFPLEHHRPEDFFFSLPTFFVYASPLLKKSERPLQFPLLIAHLWPVECKMPASLRRTRRLFATHRPTSPFFGPVGTTVFGFFALFRPSMLLCYTHCPHRSVIKKKKKSWTNSLASPSSVASVEMYISLMEEGDEDVWEMLREGLS